mgnify:CR=1 FL=1
MAKTETPQLDGHVGPEEARTTYRIPAPSDLRERFGVEEVIFAAVNPEADLGGIEWSAMEGGTRYNWFKSLRMDDVALPGALERWAVSTVREHHEDRSNPRRRRADRRFER